LKEIISKYKIKDERLVKPNNNNILIKPEKKNYNVQEAQVLFDIF
jgi:hypothetical protein